MKDEEKLFTLLFPRRAWEQEGRTQFGNEIVHDTKL
jgi:hypothetical protein